MYAPFILLYFFTADHLIFPSRNLAKIIINKNEAYCADC